MSDAETTEPPPEEPPMEIHKPKPVHNWRELLTERPPVAFAPALSGCGCISAEPRHA